MSIKITEKRKWNMIRSNKAEINTNFNALRGRFGV
jgi:hypothetical protein